MRCAEPVELADVVVLPLLRQVAHNPAVHHHRVSKCGDAFDALDDVVHRVTMYHSGWMLPSNFEASAKTGESVGLIRPNTCLEPAGLVRVVHVDGREIEPD